MFFFYLFDNLIEIRSIDLHGNRHWGRSKDPILVELSLCKEEKIYRGTCKIKHLNICLRDYIDISFTVYRIKIQLRFGKIPEICPGACGRGWKKEKRSTVFHVHLSQS